jgi:hypothetical protein
VPSIQSECLERKRRSSWSSQWRSNDKRTNCW